VGIRTQESLNRWRVLNGRDAYRFKGLKWVRRLDTGVYNAYPIYDWLTRDIWIANGKFNWAYNHLYDLYYQAGVPLEKQRVASPFISEARESLNLYRAIDPDMWTYDQSGEWNQFYCDLQYHYGSRIPTKNYFAGRVYLGQLYAIFIGYTP